MEEEREVTDEELDLEGQQSEPGVEEVADPEPKEDGTIEVPLDDDGQDDENGPDGKPAASWVKDLRKQNRTLQRDLREARRKLNEAAVPVESSVPALGPKPTFEGCGFDSDKYEAETVKWFEEKAKRDAVEAEAEAKKKQTDQRYAAKKAAYDEAKAAIPNFDEAESAVVDTFSVMQQNVLLYGSKDPSVLVLALGRNEEEAKKLAAIDDLVEFAVAVGRMEARLKVSKKPVTAPENKVTGDQGPSGVVGSTLEKLREEAARTGVYTKLNAYKRSLKQGKK